MNGGTVTINNGATTATVSAGTLTVLGSGGITTLTADGGSVVYNATGHSARPSSPKAAVSISRRIPPEDRDQPIQLYGNNATLNDPNQVVGSLVVDLEQSDNLANVELGTNIKLTRSTPP